MTKNSKRIVLLILAIILVFSLTACKKEIKVEDVKVKIEKALYQRYGEEFVVDRIGTRTANKIKFFQARIYPKSIIGTKKEGDKYYYASASVDILNNGNLSEVADTYEAIIMNEEAEKYMISKIRNLFGSRVLMKTEIKYKRLNKGAYLRTYVSGFKRKLKEVQKNKNERMEVELYIYIFNRIDNEKEKEERRQQIFDFVQYLKQEGLFKYLELGVIFIDERVLAPDYQKYKDKIDVCKKVRVETEAGPIRIPPMKLRKEMSGVLQKEVDKMSEAELLASIGKIRKKDLKGITKYDMQYTSLVYSLGMLEVKYSSSITEEDRNNKYDSLKNIILEKPYNYIYLE